MKGSKEKRAKLRLLKKNSIRQKIPANKRLIELILEIALSLLFNRPAENKDLHIYIVSSCTISGQKITEK